MTHDDIAPVPTVTFKNYNQICSTVLWGMVDSSQDCETVPIVVVTFNIHLSVCNPDPLQSHGSVCLSVTLPLQSHGSVCLSVTLPLQSYGSVCNHDPWPLHSSPMKTWCSVWSRPSWSWRGRRTFWSSVTRPSCAACSPTFWTRRQVRTRTLRVHTVCIFFLIALFAQTLFPFGLLKGINILKPLSRGCLLDNIVQSIFNWEWRSGNHFGLSCFIH